jgi:hypothetical protein
MEQANQKGAVGFSLKCLGVDPLGHGHVAR